MVEKKISEAERQKRAIFDNMSERNRKRILKKGYEEWNPFEKPNDPIDIRKDKTQRTSLALIKEFLQSRPGDSYSNEYGRGVVEICFGIINNNDRFLGMFEFSCWYKELLDKEGVQINDLSLFLASSSTRLSCHKAIDLAAQKTCGNRRQAAFLINRLVTAGLFRYVYDCGQSFLEKNYAGVVRLSDRVMIAPPGIRVAVPNGTVIVRIMPGAAFGDGRHPTTRLSVRAVDFALAKGSATIKKKKALDIGTGSGVLAITAVLLGMSRALATDIDPCARKEALENIAENRLKTKIVVRDQPLEKINGRFALIICNLRPPTLINYAGLIAEKTIKNGLVVLSGLKEDEYGRLVAAYKKGFDRLWQETEGGWCAIVLRKRNTKSGQFL